MKQTFAILTVLALMVSVLAVFSMISEEVAGHGDGGCIAANMAGAPACPEGDNFLGSLVFHVRALGAFSLAVMTVFVLALLAVILYCSAVLIFAFRGVAFLREPNASSHFLFECPRDYEKRRACRRWLSLLELSPTFV